MGKLKARIGWVVLALYAGLAVVGVSQTPEEKALVVERVLEAPQVMSGGGATGNGQWHSFLPGVFK